MTKMNTNFTLSSIRERLALQSFYNQRQDFIVTHLSSIYGYAKWDAVIISASTEMVMEVKVRDWNSQTFSTWMLEEDKYNALMSLKSRAKRDITPVYVNVFRDGVAVFNLNDIQPVFEMINGTDMPRFLVQNIAQAQEMLEAVQHPALKMQFDCYHMAMMGEEVLAVLQENIDWIGHIQFADCPGRHEPDTAQIDYLSIFTWLKQSTYTGYIAAEYRPQSHSNQSFAWMDKYFSNNHSY